MKKFEIFIGKGYDLETFVYIMQGNNECKFGITNNIENKLKQYKNERPYLKLKYCKPFENRNIARLIELKMKMHFQIISGYETTNAELKEVVDYIESSNTKLEILIFEVPENLIEKNIAYQNILKTIEINKIQKTYSIAEKRNENPNAYTKWTKIDDEKLEILFCEGKSVKELSLIFERNNGAIKSRIKKLELKEKYGS